MQVIVAMKWEEVTDFSIVFMEKTHLINIKFLTNITDTVIFSAMVFFFFMKGCIFNIYYLISVITVYYLPIKVVLTILFLYEMNYLK